MILEPKCTFNGLTRVPMACWAALGSGIPMAGGSSQHHDDLMRFCFQPGSTNPQEAVNGSSGLYLENGLVTFVAGSSPILSLSQSFHFSLYCQRLWFPSNFMIVSVWLRKAVALYGKVYEEQPLMCLSVCKLFLIAPRRCELASQKIDWHGLKEGLWVGGAVPISKCHH